MTGPAPERITDAESALASTLPASVRELYRESDGHYSAQGQWYVVWPLDRLVQDSPGAWARGLPEHLLAFGDDGTGNPFCVDLTEDDTVVRWNWIDMEVESQEGSMSAFRASWLG